MKNKETSRNSTAQESNGQRYNKKVKVRRFNIGNLVFRKVLQATKDPSQRK